MNKMKSAQSCSLPGVLLKCCDLSILPRSRWPPYIYSYHYPLSSSFFLFSSFVLICRILLLSSQHSKAFTITFAVAVCHRLSFLFFPSLPPIIHFAYHTNKMSHVQSHVSLWFRPVPPGARVLIRVYVSYLTYVPCIIASLHHLLLF